MVTLVAYQELAVFDLMRRDPTSITTPFVDQLADISSHHEFASGRRVRSRLTQCDKCLSAGT